MANLSVCCSGTNHPEFNFPWRARIARWSCTAFLVSAVWSGSSQAQQSPEESAKEENATQDQAAPAKNNPSGKIKNRQPKYDIDRIGVRGVGKGINFYSLEKEQRLGESLAKRLDRHTKFVPDPSVTDYVNRLGQKLARNSDAQLPFTIKVIDSEDTRVFALPGGYLYVDSGLILAVDSEAELAGMMAHEIAHVAARHATRSATRTDALDAISISLTDFCVADR